MRFVDSQDYALSDKGNENKRSGRKYDMRFEKIKFTATG